METPRTFPEPLIEAIASSWASIDGKLDTYLAERLLADEYANAKVGDAIRSYATGTYLGYTAEARELLERADNRLASADPFIIAFGDASRGHFPPPSTPWTPEHKIVEQALDEAAARLAEKYAKNDRERYDAAAGIASQFAVTNASEDIGFRIWAICTVILCAACGLIGYMIGAS